jgi:hypothetical protein
MRQLVLTFSALFMPMAFASTSTHPCASEIERASAVESKISDSTTQWVELRSQSATEETHRSGALKDRLEEANGALDKANQAALQDTRMLSVLIESKPEIEIWAGTMPSSSALDRILSAELMASKEMALPLVVRRCINQVADPSGPRLLAIVQSLQSSREWNASLKEVRDKVESGESALASLAQKMLRFMESIPTILAAHPRRLAQLKAQATEAQRAIELSAERQASLSDQQSGLEKRMVLLRAELPNAKAALNSCMHRVQFGN